MNDATDTIRDDWACANPYRSPIDSGQMNIDRDTPICGIRPVLLKALVRHDRFDTPRAMALLDMAEPRISETLRQLAAAGWVSWGGERESIDQWRSTPLGHRLAASRLIRRFPIAQGRTLLPKIVEAARVLNRNPDASHRIAEILLFGSVLTGEDDGDAGDIDLVVHVARRKLPAETMNALIEAEEKAMPRHLDYVQRLDRQANDLRRAIKKVSNKISLHGFSDVETFAAPHRQLYNYDVGTESEIAPDPRIQVVQPEEKAHTDITQTLPPPLDARPWPVAPNVPVALEPMDAAPLRLAQHLWIKGGDASEIAGRLGLPVQSVLAYLARRKEARDEEPPKFDISLDWMIDQAFDPSCGYAVMVEIVKLHEQDVTIECNALDADTFERLADIRMFGGSDTWISGRCDLQPMLEPVAQAASAWWAKMRDQFVGLDVRLFVLRSSAYGRAEAFGSRRPDFRSLVPPMRKLLQRLLPEPLGWEAWDHALEFVRERGRDQLFHRIGNRMTTGSVATAVARRGEPRTWHQIKATLEPQADLIRGLGDFALGVEARHIDGVVDAIRGSRLYDAVANRTGG